MCGKSYICDFCKTLTLVCVNFGTCICASLSTGLSLFSKSNAKGGHLSNGIWFWAYVQKNNEIIVLQFGFQLLFQSTDNIFGIEYLILVYILLKYGFHKKYFRKSETLTSWTLFSPIFFQISADWWKIYFLQKNPLQDL